jgi:hypothetical protein
LVRRQSSSAVDWVAAAHTDATLKRAVSHGHAQEPGAVLKRLATCVELLKQVVAIKCQDNNDLRTCGKAVQDALQFFSLAALADACSL